MKKTLLFCAVSAMMLAFCGQATVTNIAWYRLGENDPGAVSGQIAGTAFDLMQFRNLRRLGSVFYTNDVSTTANATVGSSLAVNFTGSGFFSNTLVSAATDNFGIEAWVKPANVTTVVRVIAYNGNTVSNGWGIIQDGSRFEGLLGSVAVVGSGGAATAAAGTWTHVALVRSGGKTALYINGITNGIGTALAPVAPTATTGLAIGAAPQATLLDPFTGTIDEVRVFTFPTGQFRTNDLLLFLNRVETLPASGVAPMTATLNGSVNPSGLPTSAWFEWGSTTAYGNTTPVQAAGNGSSVTDFSQVLSNLVNGATYQYHAVVSNQLGVVYGPNASAQIPLPPPVSNTNDSGPGSLRQAISDAGAGGDVTFTNGFAGTITLTSGPLVIDKPLNIIGPGAMTSFLTAGANQLLRVTGGNVVVSGLTFTGGGDSSGGPAINNGANLTLSNCEFVANQLGAAIVNSNNLVLLNSFFMQNERGALIIAPEATACVTNCTFDGNQATTGGGAILNQGTLKLVGGTLVYNYALQGPAILSTGTSYLGDTVLVGNYTFTNSQLVYQDMAGPFISLGCNFISAQDGSTGFTNGVNGDQAGTSAAPLDPGLTAIPQYNGGLTQNLVPVVGSPLIDHGRSFGMATDQRGYLRPLDFAQIPNASGGDGSDIGAVEYGSIPPCTGNCNQVTVDTSQTLRPVDARWFGANASIWESTFDSANSVSLLKEMGIHSLRFPGGGASDSYHWASNYWVGHGAEPTAFINFIHTATNIGANVFITANYGSGTTNEAADWVRCANITNHCAFKYWEIGNENYYGVETDNNTNAPFEAHDPWTYATRFHDYYLAMKAVDPTIKVGAVVIPGDDSYNDASSSYLHPAYNPRTGLTHYGWTPMLLVTLKNLGITPDFLIHHFYPENGTESDSMLLQEPANWANDAAALRQDITDYFGSGGTNIELLCTENNSDADYSQGRQSTSLVNGLYLADSLGQLMKTEFNSYLWWLFESGADTSGSFSSSLYGWRTSGDFGLALNITTRYPTFYAMKLMGDFAQTGDTILSPSSSGNAFLDVFAAQKTNGTASVFVINKDRTNSYTLQIALAGFWPGPNATVRSYGKPQDEAARTNAPLAKQDIATNSFALAGSSFSYAFPPYSLTLFSFTPAGPPLAVAPQAGQSLLIFWPGSASAWNLQQNTDLTTTNWTTPAEPVQNDGTNYYIVIQPPADSRFFRLSSP